MKKPVTLIIMDGFGWIPQCVEGNAVCAANTPNIDRYMSECPWTTIGASGMDVGLPDGQMGNSEVGHTNMGAGRIVYQQLTLITKSIRDGSMLENDVLVRNMRKAIDNDKAIHLMGLVGNGGVHSHCEHWYGVMEMAKKMGASKLYLHCITDGRDTDPHDAKQFITDLQDKIDEIGLGVIATVSGRYYAMDRDNNWDREEKAYAAFVYGEGDKANNWQEAVDNSYANDVTDEFIVPCITCEGGRVEQDDTVIFMNFRPDRARQMTRIFVDDEFDGFERRFGRFPVNYVCMAQYDATMPNVEVAYPPVELNNVLGEYLAKHGKTQLRIAETEKYAHVTFFFNGGVEEPYDGEDRCVIPSPKVATYDLQPEMSAYPVAEECVKRIESDKYDVIILNFANCDMVGHTGDFGAAVKAVEAVDECVGKVVDAVMKKGGAALITADHGNADRMLVEAGSTDPFTAHTTNPVPLIAIGTDAKELKTGGVLADLIPTMLDVMNMEKPDDMTGNSLLVK
ncbi:MAG: 2,3-bisphosphoglycerate-independent phosphoglycerate mutase [Clostridia bacterium]|nr:2,3-bisphosphoglycerate-independent phosphoglycerate mutase [Clostridia bacterium]